MIKFNELYLLCASFYSLHRLAHCEKIIENKTFFNHSGLQLLDESNGSSPPACIPSGISAFPNDFLTQEQRAHGGVLIHIFLVAYICATIGEVCHSYFVPSLEVIAERLKLPPDIAGATFMAVGTSAPELFSSLTGSFITEGDIGVGTIIGSAVFNIVGVTGLVGLILWNEELDIDWYPIARDCTAYGFTVFNLIWIISDNIVTWWEALILLIIFILYIVIIYFNKKIETWSRDLIKSNFCSGCHRNREASPLLRKKTFVAEIIDSTKPGVDRDSYSVEFPATKVGFQKDQIHAIVEEVQLSTDISFHQDGSLCSPPKGGSWHLCWWLFMYPAKLLFFLTLPNKNNLKLVPLTFIISIVWIGILSYLAVWMVTIIGYTIGIPDSVSGVTILAAGTSVPEVISSIIVAKNGYGNMAISNLVGSNTFDISFCLGAPWLIKACISKTHSLLIYSSALTYTTSTLLVTLVLFVIVFFMTGWKLNRLVGISFTVVYAVFLVLASMYELNVFGEINKPTCPI